MKQGITYPPDAQKTAQASEAPPDRSADILRQLAALQQQLAEHQAALEALKRKPSTVINQQAAQAATATSAQVQRPPGGMLFISHDLKEVPEGPKATEYTLAPGATKLACQIETAMNSDVEGYFTAKVTTNVYDTATGHHLLVPQGSTILGHDQSSQLLYGNERMDTISLKLTLPDGRTVDLGRAPVTDQQGVAGLTGRVDQHYWRLFGAVFIGGALKGGMTALQTTMTGAAGAGQVASGIASVGNQATNRVIGPLLNTRPTIEVDAGQLCNVLLLQPLHLPAMWQGSDPLITARQPGR
jgi:type IV secretion system protein VirB10